MFKVFKYHAGMSDKECHESVEKWSSINNHEPFDCRVVIFSSAFRCDIEVDSVALVLHFGALYSNLSFAQESGRCGRYGNAATNIIIACRAECIRRNPAIKEKRPATCSSSSFSHTFLPALR